MFHAAPIILLLLITTFITNARFLHQPRVRQLQQQIAHSNSIRSSQLTPSSYKTSSPTMRSTSFDSCSTTGTHDLLTKPNHTTTKACHIATSFFPTECRATKHATRSSIQSLHASPPMSTNMSTPTSPLGHTTVPYGHPCLVFTDTNPTYLFTHMLIQIKLEDVSPRA